VALSVAMLRVALVSVVRALAQPQSSAAASPQTDTSLHR
jgi:hypothetical protein